MENPLSTDLLQHCNSSFVQDYWLKKFINYSIKIFRFVKVIQILKDRFYFMQSNWSKMAEKQLLLFSQYLNSYFFKIFGLISSARAQSTIFHLLKIIKRFQLFQFCDSDRKSTIRGEFQTIQLVFDLTRFSKSNLCKTTCWIRTRMPSNSF